MIFFSNQLNLIFIQKIVHESVTCEIVIASNEHISAHLPQKNVRKENTTYITRFQYYQVLRIR